MPCENLFYFYPCILNLPREKPDYYNKARYRTPKEIAASKRESECTREFVKEIIFERTRQMRINAIHSMMKKQTFVTSKDSIEISEISGSNINENVTEIESKKIESEKRVSECSSSRKSASSGGYVTTTTTTRIVTRVVTEPYEESEIQEVHEVYQKAPSVSKVESSPVIDQNEFKRKFLEVTNQYRSKHGAPPLTLSNELCDFAQKWANHLADIKGLQHRTTCPYGENLYASTGFPVDGGTAVKSWYDEISAYNFSSPGFSSNTGHFTQLVWKNSKQVGVGMAVKDDTTYIVAYFDPRGNNENEFDENVTNVNLIHLYSIV